nr:M55 family metallopeptidase [Cytobacillus firmus]
MKQKVREVVADDLSKYLIQLPDEFKVEIAFREHFHAYRGSFYPGASQSGPKTVEFSSSGFMDVLKFLFFVL